ncbi:hypothetical protein V9T40_003973 [Parthenolecanium corni]|uniref:Uncharacterized protein n=1 Tax=Parthenolecanium corni TaxID=536013 RepID=A0AAN9Y449_9HEMI
MDLPSYDSVIQVPTSADIAPPSYSSAISINNNKPTSQSKPLPDVTCGRVNDRTSENEIWKNMNQTSQLAPSIRNFSTVK